MQTEPQTAPAQAASGNFFQYAARFTRNLVKEHDFWTRLGGVTTGAILLAQAVAAGVFMLSLPILVQPLMAVAGLALLGAGFYGVRYGFGSAWRSLEKVCTKSFPTFNPLKRIRLQAVKLLPAPLKRRMERPRKRGLTPNQQDVFLAGLTIEGSAVAVAFCVVKVVAHISALPAITVGGLATVGMAAAAYVIGTGVFDLYCSARTIAKATRAHRMKKKAARTPAATSTFSIKPVTPAFNQSVQPAAAISAPQAKAAPAPTFN